jgi:hypothetical protein
VQWDADRAPRSSDRRAELDHRLAALRAELAAHDDEHPAEALAALAALEADGPRWDSGSFERRRAALGARIRGAR